MNVVAHNLTAMNSQRVYGINNLMQAKSMEKLSSGYRINRAADDASGLSISEKMRRQIRGLTQARDNVQDGISMVQIADGALEEVHAMLQRGNELMIKAANGTLSDSDREDINKEIKQLKSAIDGIAYTTRFNELNLFPESGASPLMANAVITKSYTLDLNNKGVSRISHNNDTPGVGSPGSAAVGSLLADKIATEFVPNAVNQIFSSFSSLKNAVTSGYTGDDADKLKMAMSISYIDGPNGKLAYVEGSFYTGNQVLAGLSMKVDSADFSEDDVKNNTDRMGLLESTIAHEMMHAVMDLATPARMYRQGGAEDYPHWFVEGTAQLTGGGLTTGWNDYLVNAVKNGASDGQLSSLLKQYTVEGREYGHGYLAAAYLGQLASGSSAVTGSNIASGMNTIFGKLINEPDKSLAAVANEVLASAGSSKTFQDVIDNINNGTADGVDFVRKLLTASQDGAGSVIAPSLASKATDILKNSKATAPVYVDYVPEKLGGISTTIQAGADSDLSNRISLKFFRMSSKDLGISSVGSGTGSSGQTDGNLTMEGAEDGIRLFTRAINLVSGVRSYYGAVQNRMEHTIANLENVIENTTGSESRIRDTDMAKEMVRMSVGRILLFAGQAMLAQSNHANDSVLNYL